MNVEAIKHELESVLTRNGVNGRVNVSEIRTSDNFWERNSNIWESSDDWMDRIDVDKKAWLQADYAVKDSFVPSAIGEIKDAIEEWIDDHDSPYNIVGRLFTNLIDDDDVDTFSESWQMVVDRLSEMSLGEIRESNNPDIKGLYDYLVREIERMVNDYDFELLEDMGFLEEVYGIEYPDEEFNAIDVLAYWTTYFSPPSFAKNVELAHKCGLFPFHFDDEFYVAFGGCGMDLSPKLDAYQALSVGSVHSDSQFISGPSYAKYVVGEEVFNEVMEAIKCPPVFTVVTYSEMEPEKNDAVELPNGTWVMVKDTFRGEVTDVISGGSHDGVLVLKAKGVITDSEVAESGEKRYCVEFNILPGNTIFAWMFDDEFTVVANEGRM